MTAPAVFRHAAQKEFADAASWYEGRRLGLGMQFLSEIDRAVRLAQENPEQFPVMYRNVRCVRVRRFPYSVFFQVEPERIVVLSVFHARRDPLVWQQRR